MFMTGNTDPIQAMISQLMAGGKSNLSIPSSGGGLQMPGSSQGGKGGPTGGGGMFPGMPGGGSNPLSFIPGIGGLF